MCSGGKQHAARLSAGKTQGSAAAFDRQTTCGHAFVRRACGIRGHHVDALIGDIQFVGSDLRQRRQYTLADFAFAGVDGDFAVGVDAYPAVEHTVVVEVARQRRACLLCNSDGPGKTEGGNDNATLLEEFAAVELSRNHAAPAFAVTAARCTARTIRLCVPQRHRLPASAFLMSATLGLGLLSSKAFADMIMPLVQ